MKYAGLLSDINLIKNKLEKANLKEFSPDIFHIKDFIDIQELNYLLENLYQASGIPSAFLANNAEVLISVGWQNICTYFHRTNPESYQNCLESDNTIKKYYANKESIAYKCKNGLWDIAIPVKLYNYHMATIFLGQFFYDESERDEEYFSKQADLFSYDKRKYLSALAEVPVFTEKKVKSIISLFKSIIQPKIEKAEENIRIALDLIKKEQATFDSLLNHEDCMTVLNLLTEGIFEFDIKTKTIFANKSFFQQINCPEYINSHFTIDDWISKIHNDDVKTFHTYLLNNNSTKNNILDYRVKSNNNKWYSIKFIILKKDKTNKPLKIIGIHTDINNYKLQEKNYSEKLDFILNPENTLNLDFDSIFDQYELQRVQNSFSNAIGISSFIIAPNGKMLTEISDPTGLMDIFYNKNNKPEYAKIKKSQNNYFWYYYAPLQIKGKTIAYWYIGNVIVRESYDYVLNSLSISKKIPIQEVKKILKKCRVMDKNQFENVVSNLTEIILQITENALKNISQARYIYEKKLSEKRLNLSEKRYKDMFYSMHYSFALHKMIYDVQGKPVDYEYIDVNPAFEKLLGMSKDKIIGSTVKQLLPNTESYWIETYATVAKTGKPITFDNYSNELNKHFLVTAFSPDYDYFAVMVHDITENISMKELISEAEQKLRFFINQLPVVIWGIDKELKFTELIGNNYVNIKPGMSLFDFFKTTDTEFIPLNKHLQALRGHQEKFDWKMDNTIYEILLSPLFSQNNKIKGVIGIALDVTKQRKSEEIIQKQILDLKSKNEELERFTYTVSHDLKSPLITIKGFASCLKKDAKAGNFSRFDSDVGRIIKAADKMHFLLEDLLEISRIGRMKNPETAFDITEIIETVLDLLQEQLKANNVKIINNMSSRKIKADKSRIIEVWQNLIENAIKYRKNDVQPEIEIGIIINQETIFYVKDNGIGIPRDYQEKVFGLFEKLDKKSPGNGIGLAIVKRIIQLYEGRIWVESGKRTKQTCFYFTHDKILIKD